jgi:hypothetical protein
MTTEELPKAEAVLYLHGEGAHKSLLYTIPDVRIMVWMPFPELLAYYKQWRNVIRVHNRWAINGDYIRHIQLNVPFHAGLIHLAYNAVIPINTKGCTRIFNFMNQNNKLV